MTTRTSETTSAEAPALTNAERELLLAMRESQDHGAFSVACDGLRRRQVARMLERKGFAEWRGDLWGSSFWAITDAGRALLSETPDA